MEKPPREIEAEVRLLLFSPKDYINSGCMTGKQTRRGLMMFLPRCCNDENNGRRNRVEGSAKTHETRDSWKFLWYLLGCNKQVNPRRTRSCSFTIHKSWRRWDATEAAFELIERHSPPLSPHMQQSCRKAAALVGDVRRVTFALHF